MDIEKNGGFGPHAYPQADLGIFLMTRNVVNLDALIPREDLTVEDQSPPANTLRDISIVHMEGPMFGPDLRKPGFQRETIQWTPQKVVDLIRVFVDADLIPAVILWRSGRYVFVIDGAHRMSALLAWIHDDYGDGKKSFDYFGGYIPEEQKKVAQRTRKLVNKEIGSYADYKAAQSNPSAVPEERQKRQSNLSTNCLVAQWVPAKDAKSAEDSFFKINQAATPIDPTEKRILKARESASAIAARAISHGGSGNKYWSAFDKVTKTAIEMAGKNIYDALYEPPITGTPHTTLDIPVAGYGYNALPFIFDLVNQVNGVNVVDSTAKKELKEALPKDPDGKQTLDYLQEVERRVKKITTDDPGSLGLHPVVYFYTRGGTFQPIAFLAVDQLIQDLTKEGKLDDFTRVRKDFEDFIVEHKEAMSLIVHKLGSGGRSLPWLTKYYRLVLDGLLEGKTKEEVQAAIANNSDFTFVTVPKPTSLRPQSGKEKKTFSGQTKTAAFFAAALPNGTRCGICSALVHKNSMTCDHIEGAAEGGNADFRNGQPTHPYCNTGFKEKQKHLKKTA